MSVSKINAMEASLGLSFEKSTRDYLDAKQMHSNSADKLYSNGEGDGFFMHCTHIFSIPYKAASLALQTITDAVIAIVVGLGTVFTFGLNEDLRNEFKVRSFNLLVADTFAWLALPISIFYAPLFADANVWHLGTMRSIETKPYVSFEPSAYA